MLETWAGASDGINSEDGGRGGLVDFERRVKFIWDSWDMRYTI